MLKWKTYLLLAVCVIATQSAWALTFMDGKCEYTADELGNPDAVVELALSEKKFCRGFFLDQKLYQEIELPHFGKWSPVYPERAIREQLKQYGVPKNEPFEPWGGVYREYKVREKKAHPPIDGHEALEYTVELLYVYLRGWPQVPKSGRYGEVAVCERSVVKLYAIRTASGWYVQKPGPGDSLGVYLQYSNEKDRNRTWGKAYIERDIAASNALANQCKDRLK